MLAGKAHWIFDLDGTLTEAVHDFDHIRAQLGVPAGVGILEWLATLSPAERAPRERWLDQHEHELAGAAVAAEGAYDILATLARAGRRLGIVTRNNLRNVELTLHTAGIQSFFRPDDIVAREHAPPKPEPDGIVRLLCAWGASPADGVMVGNHHNDLAAGRRAGVTTVLVDVTGAFAWPEVTDLTVTSLVALRVRALTDEAEARSRLARRAAGPPRRTVG
jgi:HAD superfamily hydrolase (TIGR01509 family)